MNIRFGYFFFNYINKCIHNIVYESACSMFQNTFLYLSYGNLITVLDTNKTKTEYI